jgi:hypothetical protein
MQIMVYPRPLDMDPVPALLVLRVDAGLFSVFWPLAPL